MGSRLRVAALGTLPFQRCSSLRTAGLLCLVMRSVLFMGHPASASNGIEAGRLSTSTSRTTTTPDSGEFSARPASLFAARGDSFAVRGERIVRVAEAQPSPAPSAAEVEETSSDVQQRPENGKEAPVDDKAIAKVSTMLSGEGAGGALQEENVRLAAELSRIAAERDALKQQLASTGLHGSSCKDAGQAAGKTSKTSSHSCELPVVRLESVKAISVSDDYWRLAALPPFERFMHDDFYLTDEIFNGVGEGHTWDLDSIPAVHDRIHLPKMYPDPKVEKALCGIFSSVGGVNAARARIYGEMQQAPPGSLELWRSWSAFGNTWRCSGHARRALTCYLQALRFQRDSDADLQTEHIGDAELGTSKHKDSCIVRFNIAMVFQSSRRLEDAKAVLQAITDEVQAAKGTANYDTNGQLGLYNWKLCELNVLLNVSGEAQKCAEQFEAIAPNITGPERQQQQQLIMPASKNLPQKVTKRPPRPSLEEVDATAVATHDPALARFHTNEFYLSDPSFRGLGKVGKRLLLAGIRDRAEALVYKNRSIEEGICSFFFQEGGVDSARRSIVEALTRTGLDTPRNWELWNGLGNAWRCDGHAFRALQCFLKAEALRGHTDSLIGLNIATVLQHTGHLVDARKALEMSGPRDSPVAEFKWCDLTVALVEVGLEDLVNAEKCMRQVEAGDLRPVVSDWRMRLGLLPRRPSSTRSYKQTLACLVLAVGILLYGFRSLQGKKGEHSIKTQASRKPNGKSQRHHGRR